MKKRNKTVYIVIGALFIICLAIIFLKKDVSDIVIIKSGEEIIDRIDLNSVTEPYSFTVENNGVNTIYVEKGKISVIDSDCPDKICQNQSASGIFPIVCLPHKLVIEKEN